MNKESIKLLIIYVFAISLILLFCKFNILKTTMFVSFFNLFFSPTIGMLFKLQSSKAMSFLYAKITFLTMLFLLSLSFCINYKMLEGQYYLLAIAVVFVLPVSFIGPYYLFYFGSGGASKNE